MMPSPHSESMFPTAASDSRFSVTKVIFRCRWLFLYVSTVAAMLWWYEVRPARQAARQVQGAWQRIEGVVPNEQPGNSYRYVEGDDSWFLYSRDRKWNVQRSRINLRPADNFFVVERSFGFDYGNTRENEYIMCLKNDSLFVIRGIARLDPVKENRIEKLRRVELLPDEARGGIQSYLNRMSSARVVDRDSREPGQ